MTTMDNKPTLRTQQGIVVLKQKREPVQLTGPESGNKMTIRKDWLKDCSNETYRQAIKQAMVVAARGMDLVDAEDPLSGQPPAAANNLKAMIETIKNGTQKAKVAVIGSGINRKKNKNDRDGNPHDRKKEKLIKYSQKCCSLAHCNRRTRYFLIDQGQMKVYKSQAPNAPMKAFYELRKATYIVEEKMTHVAPKWEAGDHKNRLRVDFEKRTQERKTPIYLYPEDKKQLKNWQKTFKLAKMLANDSDTRTLKGAVMRATFAPLVKAWQALFIYQNEVRSTKALVKQTYSRLMMADLSRGWTKLKFCYIKEKGIREKRRLMQLKVVQWMSEMLGRFDAQKGKTVADVREGVVTRIQERFRQYRDTMIFHRTYPLNATNISKVQQARAGLKLDVKMDALKWTEAVELLLDGQALEDYKKSKDLLRTQRQTYSEGPFPPTDSVNLFVSDNLQSLSFTRVGTGQTDWSNFVNLDRISCVILHSEPFAGAKLINDASQDKGVWCTINGPRIHWNQTTIPPKDDDENATTKDMKTLVPSGAWSDGFALCQQLSSPTHKSHWLNFKITLQAAELKKNGDSMKTFCCLHAFGYTYTTKVGDGVTPDFGKPTFEAQIPFPAHGKGDKKNLDTSLLLNSQISAEIFLSSDRPNLVADDENRTLYLVGNEPMSKVPNFLDKLQGDDSKFDIKIPLGLPTAQPGSKDGHIDISIEMEAKDPAKENRCLSPEFCGAGIPTNIFTSHRGAWYDPSKKLGKFSMEHVANFIELSLRGLQLPEDEPAERPGQETAYRIKATLRGFSSVTQPMHRARPNWIKVLGSGMSDPSVIRFNGCRLYLPLPPGCWSDFKEPGDAKAKRTITVEVLKQESSQTPPLYRKFRDQLKDDKKSPAEVEKRAFIAHMVLDGRLIIDEDRSVTVFCARAEKLDIPETDVLTNQAEKVPQASAKINLEFTLRDREYVKAALARPENRRTICAGDKAMLVVEEKLEYPQSRNEFDSKRYPGKFDAERTEEEKQGMVRLRDPCLTSEFQESGLSQMVPEFFFRQSFIPSSCHDLIPHKFILPLSEKEYLDRALPGVWWRVVDQLAKKMEMEEGKKNRSNLQHRFVEHLSHTTRQIPVTVLAMYHNETCDVELAPDGLKSWRDAKLVIPGKVLDDPNARDDTRRYILKDVPLRQLKAVHCAGINVYDAAFKTTKELLEAKEGRPKNDLNPRIDPKEQTASKRFSIACGPMPADVSPAACKYEWSMHVRLQNERELHSFVAMIRRCVRIDHYQQAIKMLEYQNVDTTKTGTLANYNRPRITATGGQLDILLVEARRLAPRKDRSHSSEQNILAKVVNPERIDEKYLPDVTGTVATGKSVDCTPKYTSMDTFVKFRIKYRKSTDSQAEGNIEVIPYKGKTFQQSPSVDGTDSPSWDTKQIGQPRGHLFKTPMINDKIRPLLILDFEIWQKNIAGMQTSVGFIQREFRHFIDLDRNKTFSNMWLPIGKMASVSEKEKKYVLNDTGEIHIMARWTSQEKLQAQFDEQQQPWPVYWTFQQSIWNQVCAPTIREPIYGLEALYIQYAPNVVKSYGAKSETLPEKPKEQAARNVEQLVHTIPYLNCLEESQKPRWDAFRKQIKQENKDSPLPALRLSWMESRQTASLDRLQSLIERGIPSADREELWGDLTLMNWVRKQGVRGWKSGDQAYVFFLEQGVNQKTEALHQLQEDSLNIATWESDHGELKDLHLARVAKARDVCTALLAIPKSGIAYCESLLVLAYFLLLPQGTVETNAGIQTGGQPQAQLKQHSEAWAFWLLYTLIVPKDSGAYVVYYGVSLPEDDMPVSVQSPQQQQQQRQQMRAPQLCAGGGALLDVQILDCCLMYHDRDLWNRMQALGFHMANTFYGMFMRLYATYMPTASVFRFWDLLFSQSTLHREMVNPHARGHLIDLAFAVLMARKAELMLCESAPEMHECILGMLASLYDASTVIDLTMVANQMLWGGTGFYNAMVGMAREQQEKRFKTYWVSIKKQNQLLKKIMHEDPFPSNIGNQVRKTNHNAELSTQGIGTKELMKHVLPKLIDSFGMLSERNLVQNQNKGMSDAKFWAMHRPMPPLLTAASEDQVDKCLIYCSEKATNPRGLPQQAPPPTLVSPPRQLIDKPFAEVNGIDSNSFAEVLRTDMDPAWNDTANKIWNEFKSGVGALQMPPNQNSSAALAKFVHSATTLLDKPDYSNTNTLGSNTGLTKDRISFNELFIAMICASKGTVGEKAGALFNIYSRNAESNQAQRHRIQISRIAVTQTHDMDMADVDGQPADKLFRESEEAKQYALRLTVRTKKDKPMLGSDRILGHVWISSLSSYSSTGIDHSESRTYDIWGEAPNIQQGKLFLIGEMELAIAWTPTTISKPEVGQLTLKLSSVNIFPTYNSDYWTLNPYVEVHSPKGARKEFQPIPRGHIRKKGTLIGDTGAFTSDLLFEETVSTGHFIQSLFHSRKGMGFDQASGQYRWNETFGQMSSIESWECHKDFVQLSQSRAAIDLAGVRIIVQSIFTRCMLNLTNRQAIQIADGAFNSRGIVPGILKVLLVGGDPSSYAAKTWKELEEAKVGTDVTDEVVAEHERQIAENGGFLTLFRNEHVASKKQNSKPLNLRDMKIKGLGKKSFLAVRYIQAGDGERLWKPVPVESNGNIVENSEIDFDEGENSTVNKEEFISCVLASPLISEALRRLGHCETSIQQRPMRLDVEIMDPHKLDDVNRFADEVNVEHSVLLEVWDADIVSKDFLGECWLPPISSLGPIAKDFVLPLKKADYSEFAEPFKSRKDEKKEIKAKEKLNTKVTGDLHVSASWTFPIDVKKELEGESVEERARLQDVLHAGKLFLKIKRATDLRLADAAKGKKSDPQVTVWKRNDRTGNFDPKPWFKTPTKSNTDHPEWTTKNVMSGIIHIEDKEEERLGLLTRFGRMFESKQTTDKREYDKNVGVLDRQMQHVRIIFNDTGSAGRELGEHHSNVINFSDTIREFKTKLAKACDDEAEWQTKSNPGENMQAALYKDIKIRHQHLVMVFIPTRELHRLFTEGKMNDAVYKETLERAKKDPSNWQPLDPAMTFSQYPQYFKQRSGNQAFAEIRIQEATEAYKLVNLRYKKFNQAIRPAKVQDKNEFNQCYAMARYVHKKDGSTEWRPCYAQLATEEELKKRPPASTGSDLKIKWLHNMSADTQFPGADEVMLVPRSAQIEHALLDEDVKKVLDEADVKTYRARGKSDWEIVDILNRQLQKRWNEEENSKKEKASVVTVEMLQGYLLRQQHNQQKEASKKTNKDTKTT